MIIQTGMRTDIPAFYAPWFANRLKEGFVCVRNPYRPWSVTKYRLSSDVVDLIAFCTKNPAPMFPYMNLLKPYSQYWFVTITPYDKAIEPYVPDKEKVLRSFRVLSKRVGENSVAWRYDPILISAVYSPKRHLAEFAHMAEELAGYTHTCIISFLDLYPKVRKNFPEAEETEEKTRKYLAKEMVSVAERYGITVKACAEGGELEVCGADCSGCMNREVLEKASGKRFQIPSYRSQRPACGCVLGNDIGAYDTCGHLCRYCYANADTTLVRRNMADHDPASPFLVGHERPGDVMHTADQKSWLDP